MAAQPSSIEKLRKVPAQTWINVAIFVVALFAIVRLWRALKRFNDYAPYIVACLVGSGVFFYWVYTRTEPALLTPIVERVTPFFPSQSTQRESVDRARQSHER